ncbi:hypothetical protein FQR65_LT11914 [Abscondita terminalis]|nr:hypothetical protein FQR65_LT11914 [Abscondita terminalis]
MLSTAYFNNISELWNFEAIGTSDQVAIKSGKEEAEVLAHFKTTAKKDKTGISTNRLTSEKRLNAKTDYGAISTECRPDPDRKRNCLYDFSVDSVKGVYIEAVCGCIASLSSAFITRGPIQEPTEIRPRNLIDPFPFKVTTVPMIVDLLKREVFQRYGYSKAIILNNGAQFTPVTLGATLSTWCSYHWTTPIYHLHMTQWSVGFESKDVPEKPEALDECVTRRSLPITYPSECSAATGMTPNKAFLGYELNQPRLTAILPPTTLPP